MQSAQSRPLSRDGVVRPEQVRVEDRTSDTPAHYGIEIDNALERPKDGALNAPAQHFAQAKQTA